MLCYVQVNLRLVISASPLLTKPLPKLEIKRVIPYRSIHSLPPSLWCFHGLTYQCSCLHIHALMAGAAVAVDLEDPLAGSLSFRSLCL